ncbi:uncharacterized protein LOC135835651 [Planococcus citri]|uniref:uncharacterized protein LOC135835651 n=1 Tax=Planococcus citri TaxID=170843 RepID=UPI0031F9B4E9
MHKIHCSNSSTPFPSNQIATPYGAHPRTAVQDTITGCVTGISDVLSTHPLWTLKTLTQDGLKSKGIARLLRTNPLILYNGVFAHSMSMIPITTVRVFLSSTFEKCLGDRNTPATHLLTTGIAGGLSSLISTPTELGRTIKLKSTTLQKEGHVLTHSFQDTSQIMKKVWQTEGHIRLLNGFSSIALRDGIYTAAFFSGARLFKKVINPYFENEVVKSIVAYSTVSIFASFINHPFDVIKTRQHVAFTTYWQLKKTNLNDSKFLKATVALYREKGVAGFWLGYPARGMRFLIGLVVKASVLEQMEYFWGIYNQRVD